jgi:hypothetical protein
LTASALPLTASALPLTASALPLAASALPLAASALPLAASASFSTEPATTGHGKAVLLQVTAKPSLNDLGQVSGHEWDYTDTIGSDYFLQGPGDCTANQGGDTQFRQAKSFLDGKIVSDHFMSFADCPPGSGFQKLYLPGDIKDGRNSIFRD